MTTTTTTTEIDPTLDRAEQIRSAGAMLGASLPTLAEMRAARDFLPITAPARPDGTAADSWLGRIAQAVAYAYRNREAYGPDDRAEAEAELLADAMARLTLAVEAADLLPAPADLLDLTRAERNGAPMAHLSPRADDPQHSVTAYYGRASNLRRALDARRRAERTAPDAPGAEPLTVDAYFTEADREGPAPARHGRSVIADDAAEAKRRAADLCRRLKLDIPTLAYAACRSTTGTARLTDEQRAEIGLTPDAYRKAAHRERVRVLAEAEDAADLIRFLTRGADARSGHLTTGPDGSPQWSPAMLGRGTKRDPRCPVLTYSTDDRSAEAKRRTGRTLARPDRLGTASIDTAEDVAPTRPDTAEAARDLCAVSTTEAVTEAEAQQRDDYYARTGQAIRNAARYSARR